MKKDYRDQSIEVMLTLKEKASIQNDAKLHGATVSHLVRQKILLSVEPPVKIYRLVGETVDEIEMAILQLDSMTEEPTASEYGAILKKTVRQLKEIIKSLTSENKNMKSERRSNL